MPYAYSLVRWIGPLSSYLLILFCDVFFDFLFFFSLSIL